MPAQGARLKVPDTSLPSSRCPARGARHLVTQELDFKSLDEIRRAVQVGLVDPTDELRFPTDETWHPVGSVPELAPPRFRTVKRWWRPILESFAAILGPRVYWLFRNSARDWKGEGWSRPRKRP